MTAANSNKMSFTVGGLLLSESVLLAMLYMKTNDWAQVRKAAVADNLLQIRTWMARERIVREVVFRLMELSPDELSLFLAARQKEQGYWLWLAICRRYPFIAEFTVDILHERFIRMSRKIERLDFDNFFDKKAEWDSRLGSIKPSTRLKLRSVLFRIMKEAGIISQQSEISPIILSSQLADHVSRVTADALRIFPGYVPS